MPVLRTLCLTVVRRMFFPSDTHESALRALRPASLDFRSFDCNSHARASHSLSAFGRCIFVKSARKKNACSAVACFSAALLHHINLSLALQYRIETSSPAAVAIMAGAIMIAGFTLPYWVRYAIMLTGISCKEEILRIRNVHISLLA